MKILFELLAEGGVIRLYRCDSSFGNDYLLLTDESYFDSQTYYSEHNYASWENVWEALTTKYPYWSTMYPGYINPIFVDFVRKSYEHATSQSKEHKYSEPDWQVALDYSRKNLVETALNWEARYKVIPSITSAVSEYDAARIIGLSAKKVEAVFQNQTAVTKGHDFIWDGIKYQVKANRPSGRKGSKVTMISKPKNYDWDNLIWILYD